MDRRDFLTARPKRRTANQQPAFVETSADKAGTGQQFRTNSGISPYTGPWTEQEIVHLLKRTMFGAKKADVDYFRAMTMSQAVDELLNPTAPNPGPPVKEYTTSTQPGTPDANIAQGSTWVNDINNDGTVQSQRRASYKKWWTGVKMNQDRSIREKLILFLVD